MEEFYVIPEYPRLEDANKNICYGTDEPYIGEQDQVSEWAMVYAFQDYEVGDLVLLEILEERVMQGVTDQTLMDLVDMGLIDMFWDEDSGDFIYKAKQCKNETGLDE